VSEPRFSVIIPTLNEENNIANVLGRIPDSIWSHGEVIVVDSSTDRTPIIARRHGAKVIKAQKLGKGYAMKLGASKARGDILIFLDGDKTDPPEYIPLMVRFLRKYDVVICSRNPNHSQGALGCRLMHYLGLPFMRNLFKLIGFSVRGDPLAGFRAMRKDTWGILDLKSDDFLIETEMNIKIVLLGLSVLEIPIPTIPRGGGLMRSKYILSIDQQARIVRAVLHARRLIRARRIGPRIVFLRRALSLNVLDEISKNWEGSPSEP